MTTEGVGGTHYGPSKMPQDAEPDRPVEEELKTARSLGRRVSEVAARLKSLRLEEDEQTTAYAA
jgi:NAD(P)H dehydrogenase (quinone)